MRARAYSYFMFLLAVILTACGPAVTHHPKPDLAIDFTPFAEAGCPANEYGQMQCAADSPLAAFDCALIMQPDDLLGGLDPAYPIAMCVVRPDGATDWPADGTYFYNAGGLIPSYIRYIVYRDESFQVIHNIDELANVYAPVESEDEALSFALAATDLAAYYNLERQPGYNYEVDTLEDTHVEAVEGGYVVHLYHYQTFGCGPHWTSTVDVKVTTGGEINMTNVQEAFKNPAEDDLCVD